jgi:hypothetical protein
VRTTGIVEWEVERAPEMPEMVVLGGVDEVVEALSCLRDGGYVKGVEEEENLLDDLWWYLGG